MVTMIFLDSCVFNFLFNREDQFHNFAIQLPPEKYKLYITPEVEREINDIPDISKSSHDNALLKKFIQDFRQKNVVKRLGYFSLATYGDDEETLKYKDGFGSYDDNDGGSFLSYGEVDRVVPRDKYGNPLSEGNWTDKMLAARSVNSIVLTCDDKRELKRAREDGKKVVFLGYINVNRPPNPFDQSGLTLDQYIEKHI